MLSGVPPFNGKTDKIIYEKILEGRVDFPSKKWKNVSAEAQSLILKMLEYDP
jgi:calcium-dependent protein kinase